MQDTELYIASIRKHVLEAEEKVVFDRYHLMIHMGKAVDEVRKAEHRELIQSDDDRSKLAPLGQPLGRR